MRGSPALLYGFQSNLFYTSTSMSAVGQTISLGANSDIKTSLPYSTVWQLASLQGLKD